MSTLFEKLENETQADQQSDPRLNDFQRIWKASAGTPMPQAPDTDAQWAALRLKMAEEVTHAPRGIRFPQLAVALTALTAIFLVFWFTTRTTHPLQYATTRGEILPVSLPDQSQVALNADSTLTLSEAFNSSNREVALSGEAWFSVEKGDFPFLIHTGIADVKVLGTKFNVYARGELVEVGVTEGRVEVSVSVNGEVRREVLHGGQRISCSKTGFIGGLSQADIKHSEWMTGEKLHFEQKSMSHICAEIERYYDVNIELGSADIGEMKVTGLLEGNAESMVSTLCILSGRTYALEDGRYVIH